MTKISVGIDLGTTNCCIAIYRNGKVEIVRDDDGSYVVPSVVTFTENGRLIGKEAKDKSYLHIKNSIYEVKRLIGQNFLNDDVQIDIQNFPYKVINHKGTPKIEVQVTNKVQTYFPEEISAFLLEKLKSNVEDYVGEDIERVVVTIPAYFNEFQRDATKEAAQLAGFKEVRILNESTAAAIAFNHQNLKSDIEKNVLIYDFGGGTFHVSIATVNKMKCVIKASGGDLHLGGSDIDQNLVNHIKTDYKSQYGSDIETDAINIRRLKNACENGKKTLCGKKAYADIHLSQLENGQDYETRISRVMFEKINKELFEKTINIVKKCLTDAKLATHDIDEVLLVGGSSRIPKVQSMLSNLFGEEKINKTLNPDECVAYGAAIHCVDNKIEVLEITPLGLGTDVLGDSGDYRNLILSTIIPRNTPIPVSKSGVYVTSYDNQTTISIKVIQGDCKLVKDNFELGRFAINGLTKAPAGMTEINVYFSLNDEGILDVTASEIGKNNSESTQIDIERRGLFGEEFVQRLEQMKMERGNRESKDRYLSAKYELESLCLRISNSTETDVLLLTKSRALLKWLESTSIHDLADIEKETNNLFCLIHNP